MLSKFINLASDSSKIKKINQRNTKKPKRTIQNHRQDKSGGKNGFGNVDLGSDNCNALLPDFTLNPGTESDQGPPFLEKRRCLEPRALSPRGTHSPALSSAVSPGFPNQQKGCGRSPEGCVLLMQSLSRVRLFGSHQAPLSRGFPSREYWSGLPFPTPRDPPNPGIEPVSLMSLALVGGFLTTSTTWEAPEGQVE